MKDRKRKITFTIEQFNTELVRNEKKWREKERKMCKMVGQKERQTE